MVEAMRRYLPKHCRHHDQNFVGHSYPHFESFIVCYLDNYSSNFRSYPRVASLRVTSKLASHAVISLCSDIVV